MSKVRCRNGFLLLLWRRRSALLLPGQERLLTLFLLIYLLQGSLQSCPVACLLPVLLQKKRGHRQQEANHSSYGISSPRKPYLSSPKPAILVHYYHLSIIQSTRNVSCFSWEMRLALRQVSRLYRRPSCKLSWLEHCANNAKIVGSIPIHLKVGHDDHYGSFPTQNILWFYDIRVGLSLS